ncbi:MAG TPA: efflux RND transporter permease subunit [Bacteroidia bacterium]|jgi:CzcA family heavy metal efflux pump|nr:efflux RND transporter permease subunit [Bacteroidia bacterium]
MNRKFYSTHRVSVSFLLLVILLAGVFAFNKLQTSLFPEITFPKIKIIADNGQEPVDKMMITVTKPLEAAIKQVPGLHMIQSSTSRGSCEISAYFEWNVDVNLCQQQIESRIAEIRNTLPAELGLTVEKMNPSLLAVMGYTLEAKNKTPIEQKLIANNIIKPFLSQVNGISAVRILGGKTKEYWLELKTQEMSELGITPVMINDALAQTAFILSNGYSYDNKRLYLNLTDAGIYSKDDLENVVVRNDGKRPIYVKDVADVDVHEQVEYTKINANGEAALLVNVFKQPNSNLIEVSDAMQTQVKQLNKILPNGVKLVPYYVQSNFVNDAIKSVEDCLWIGLLLAIIVTVIFLRSLKASLSILITIPITLALTLTGLYAMGYTLNIMTLGAIAAAIGLIIDDAIVVVEQIHRTHEEFPEENTNVLLGRSMKYLLPSMIGSSLSTIVIFVPFVLMGGVAGAYFNVLTNTMIITLISSFFVTWIGLPVIYLQLAGKKLRAEKRVEAKPQKQKHTAWISFFIKRPILSLLFVAFLIGSIVYIYPRLETGFLPDMDEGTIVLDYKSLPGTTLEETDRELCEVEKLILSVPEVQDYTRRTGAEMGFFITEPNRGDYLIQLKKDRSRTTDEVIDDIRKKIESTQPALQIDFGQIIGDMLGDLMASAQPIEVKVFGTNATKLNEYATQIADIVDSVKGTEDVFDGIVVAGPEVDVRPDFVKLAQFGVTPTDFQFQMQTQLEGNVVGSIPENNQLTSIRMIYPNSKNKSFSDMQKQNIFLADGKLKPITDLATVDIKPGVTEIRREDLQSMVAVTARLNGVDLGTTMKSIRDSINRKIHFPQGYHVAYGGAYKEQQESFKELLLILFTASLLVFAVIIFLFRDIKIAFMILIISVLGIAGSYMALYLTNTPLNVGSYTGLIMIIGIIGENAIFTFQQFRLALNDSDVNDAIVYSIATRLRPKLMTALGAIIALMPLALGIGTGAQLHQPLAIAVIGGFLAALPLLLIVFPTMLRVFYRKEARTEIPATDE